MNSTIPNQDYKSIVENHQEKVRNTCFQFVKNPDDADEVEQDVFIAVYESLSHFREESELSTWIYRIAVNKSLDFIRKCVRNDFLNSHLYSDLIMSVVLGQYNSPNISKGGETIPFLFFKIKIIIS